MAPSELSGRSDVVVERSLIQSSLAPAAKLWKHTAGQCREAGSVQYLVFVLVQAKYTLDSFVVDFLAHKCLPGCCSCHV